MSLEVVTLSGGTPHKQGARIGIKYNKCTKHSTSCIFVWLGLRPMPLDPHSGYQVYEAEVLVAAEMLEVVKPRQCEASARWLVREHKVPAQAA